MRPLLPRGLFPRYAAALTLLTVLVVATAGGVQLVGTYRETLQSAERVQAVEARAAAARIEQFFRGIEGAFRESVALPWNERGLDAAARREEFYRLMKILPSVAALRVADGQGRERLYVSRIDMDRIDSMRDASDIVQLARSATPGAAVYGKPYFREGSEPFVTLVVPDRDGRAVAAAEIDLKFVGDVVRDIRIGRTGRAFVVDGDGHLVAHPDQALVLRRTDLKAFEPLARLRALLAEGAGRAAGMVSGPDLGGAESTFSAAAIAPVDWIVVAEQSRAEVLGPVYQALRGTAIVVIAGFVLALLVSFGLALLLARPIVELRRGAARVASGDLQARIGSDRRDELGELARDFDRMAAQLQEYTAGLEKKVAERTSELQAALQARALFLAAASHDLRQPLYAISLLADTLSSEPLDESSAAILAKQREAISVLRALFDNLLDLSRFDAGEVKPVLRVVPLRDLLAPAVLETEVLCHARGLSFHSEIADAWVSTDPDLLRRVASNLLSNAVRYTSEGGVMLSSWPDDGFVTVEIRDTGIGIAPEDQARVFEEFVQLGNPGRDREKGVGLGLSIVKRICDLLGTPVAMRSVPGRGTSFTLRIPLAEAPSAGASAAVDHPSDPEVLRGTRVWVVEDDPMVRDALGLQFGSWGVAHAFARSSAELEAHRAAEGDWPDALLVDDMLGGDESGLEIATWLKARMEAHRIVLVTGNVDAQRLERLEASGLDVLRKPLSSADLARCLAKAMGASAVSVAWSDPAVRPGPARAPAG